MEFFNEYVPYSKDILNKNEKEKENISLKPNEKTIEDVSMVAIMAITSMTNMVQMVSKAIVDKINE
ncbi:hypothetical protein [Anaerofustis butyriciformans]|uniref:hypothetical protein n=1 Tax=Anaerofustis butyriciformans TaxID=3108533 RepID=UPI002E3445B4|nr:hypothetical protein [Anaerofustis sp. HA2171]